MKKVYYLPVLMFSVFLLYFFGNTSVAQAEEVSVSSPLQSIYDQLEKDIVEIDGEFILVFRRIT